MLGGDKGANMLAIKRRYISDGLLAAPALQSRQVTAVSIQCMRRHAPLDLQMGKKILNTHRLIQAA